MTLEDERRALDEEKRAFERERKEFRRRVEIEDKRLQQQQRLFRCKTDRKVKNEKAAEADSVAFSAFCDKNITSFTMFFTMLF